MSSSSSLAISRRGLLRSLLAWPLAGLAAAPKEPIAGLERWGSGELRRFGLLIYEVTLWAREEPTRPPLALDLKYRRAVSGRKIAEFSIAELRELGGFEAELERWREAMVRIFPDARAGDRLVCLYLPEGAHFYRNGRWLGGILEPEFAKAFFGIWLDARTSDPSLRAALLRSPKR
ncbi:MAG: chalcone isomerase family protein [Candidatus Competibacteraceae bacterium]|nr:chalcone isomerase family protein [Candidatus Competibacteraceae bacterium]